MSLGNTTIIASITLETEPNEWDRLIWESEASDEDVVLFIGCDRSSLCRARNWIDINEVGRNLYQ